MLELIRENLVLILLILDFIRVFIRWIIGKSKKTEVVKKLDKVESELKK